MEGELAGEWVFILPDKKRVKRVYGPARKAHLAFFFDEGALKDNVQVHQMTRDIVLQCTFINEKSQWALCAGP